MVGTAGIGALAGCSRDALDAASGGGQPEDQRELVRAIDRAAVPIDGSASSSGLDDVAARLARRPVVGIGESSHGIREFKALPARLVRRLVDEHDYRLLALEGTLGEFDRVEEYVTGGAVDLADAMAAVTFHFWRTEALRETFEWLREFNDGRPEDDQVVVRGYDAQFHDVNARALRSFLDRVDPDFLAEVDSELDALAAPSGETSGAETSTDDRAALVEDLRERLQSGKSAYVEESSESEWRLAKRHVWALERGLDVTAAFHSGETARGEELRDEAMAANVAWLRDWTGSDRAVVLGSANHTMRGYRASDQRNARMGQHLTDELGADYYSLGLTFGDGSFTAPAGESHGEFATYELDGPVDGTLAATLAESSHSEFFLDFADAREADVIADWLDETERAQFTVPNAADRGAVTLPAAPGDTYDGVLFLEDVSAASFSPSD